MAASKKKRTKKYSGANAQITRPTVTRISAVHRSKPSEWLHQRRRTIRIVGRVLLVLLFLMLTLSGILSLLR